MKTSPYLLKAGLLGLLSSLAAMQVMAGGVPPDDAKAIVERLYRDYPPGGPKSLWGANAKVLNKYFDKELSDLILKDQACVERNGGAPCLMGFHPLVCGQDYDPYPYAVSKTQRAENGRQRVYMAIDQDRIALFIVGDSPNGARIEDILCADPDVGGEPSLSLKSYLYPPVLKD